MVPAAPGTQPALRVRLTGPRDPLMTRGSEMWSKASERGWLASRVASLTEF